MIGVRGSGENPTQTGVANKNTLEENLGPEETDIANRLKAAQGSNNLQVEAVPYPASTVPDLAWDGTKKELARIALQGPKAVVQKLPIPESAREGAELLKTSLESACSGQPIVLSGYSQGALVIRLALDGLKDRPDILQRIKGIALVADPTDALIGPSLPDDLEALTKRTCTATDPVCNTFNFAFLQKAKACSDNPNGAACPHTQYKPKGTKEAADFLNFMLELPSGPLQLPSSPQLGGTNPLGSLQ
ncbi:cutinase family protein [Streptomyces sp. NPDC002078]